QVTMAVRHEVTGREQPTEKIQHVPPPCFQMIMHLKPAGVQQLWHSSVTCLILIRVMIMAAASAIAWLFAGRQISMLVDRIMTIPLESLPVSPLAYEGGSLRIGDRVVDGSVHIDGNRVVLSAGGQSFTLGAL